MSLTSTVKRAIASGWDVRNRLAPGPPAITILYYHAITGAHADGFDAQMSLLKRTANIVRCDHHGPLDPDRPNVAVTFDDAFRSVRENALPALVRHKVPATIFVPTGWLGRAPGWAMETSGDREEVVMSAEELTDLPSDLIDIGSHTVVHPRLSQLAPDEVDVQLRESRAALEALLNRPVETLAFPYGDHDAITIERAREAGYRFVFTVEPQAVRPGEGAISRGRTSADPADSLSLFALKSRGAYAVMPYFYRLKRRLRAKGGGR